MTRMKDSGNPWVREIPGDWFEKKLRYLVELRGEKSVTTDYKKYVGLENIMSQTGQYVQTGIEVDLTENLTFEIGDILFGKLRPYLRKYWRAEFSGTASSEFVIIKGSSLNLNFLFWAIQSDSFINDVDSSTYGSKMPRASWEYMKNIKLPFPESIEEQTQIADFLDKKVAQLDKVKSLLEEQIKTLEDYRQSLIYETVTKGLDKTVPLKESGIDWIGQIPEGWEVKNFKYVATIKDGTHDTPEYFVEGVPLITSKNLDSVQNRIDFDSAKNISYDDHIKISQRSDVKKGDILMPMIGTVGGATQVLVEKEFSIKNVALFKVAHDEVLSRFLYYQLNSRWTNSQLSFMMSGGVQSFVSLNMLSKVKLIIPTSEEIKKINLFLDSSVGKINQMIAIKKDQIENINKQRQTLIYDYVTGKRRV